MPELPEVETIRRGLDQRVRGRVITKTHLGEHRGFQFSFPRFISTVNGQTIEGFSRRGKYLVFELDRSYCVFHLGMTGQLTVRNPGLEDVPFQRNPVTGLQRSRQHPVDKHTYLQFQLDSGESILFRDIRKFGKVRLLPRDKVALERFFGHLGLEPFTSAYELGTFVKRMRGRKTKIKTLLLDQSFVAGLGNIYADEVLFESGIYPERRVEGLRVYEMKALFETIPRVLKEGIRFGGTSFRDFVNSEGALGEHQQKLNVYGRGGEPCRRCASVLKKIVVSQRGTHFCPFCQPRRGRRRGRAGGER